MAKPELRFPEFTDEWEEINFKEVFDCLEYGMNVASTDYDGTNKYIRITDIDDISHRYLAGDIVSPLGELNDKYLVKENDILFARTGGSTGKSYLYRKEDGKLYFAGFLIRGNVKSEFDTYFIFSQTLTEKYNKWVKIMSIRSGQPGINAIEYALFKFMCPGVKEQKKIAYFLSSIDDMIQIQEKEISVLEGQKKGVVQKIFNCEVRFKANDGSEYPKWEEKKLEEVVVFLDGQRRPLEKGERLSGIYPYYGASGIIDYVDGYLFEGEHILLSEDGANIIDRNYRVCFLANGKYWVNNHAHVLRARNGNNNNFICEQLESLNYIKYNTGTAQPKLNQDVCKKIRLKMPCFQEQQKIADCLFAFDEIIKIKREKLEVWKKIKKGLLQQMFV